LIALSIECHQSLAMEDAQPPILRVRFSQKKKSKFSLQEAQPLTTPETEMFRTLYSNPSRLQEAM
jgi:hypothetical protein